RKHELIVGIGVGRKPVAAIDVLPVRFELGKALISFGHALAFDFHDLQVLVINPDAAQKEAFTNFLGHYLGLDVEHIGINCINVLVALIRKVILNNLACFKGEGLNPAEVINVLICYAELHQGRLRKKGDLLKSITAVVKNKLRGTMVLTCDLSSHSDGLNN